MAIIKNDIPILEYDDSQTAVIMPNHNDIGVVLPEIAVCAFLGETIGAFAKDHDAKMVAMFKSISKDFPIYVVEYKGREICLCESPVGSAAATSLLDWLIGHGVKKIISSGSCGALIDLPENAFLIPTKALRDEGTSYHYLPPTRFVELNKKMIASIEKTLNDKGIPFEECTTWSTDGFFRETKDKVDYRRHEGCAVVDMECAALAACAQFRGVEFGQILYTADTLANVDMYDERDWGEASRDVAVLMCMDVARGL